MKGFKTIALIGIFLLVFHGLYAQRNEKVLEVCERYYEDGDYQKALKTCSRQIKKLKQAGQGYAVAEFQMYQAKYYEALGNYTYFEETLSESLKNKKIKGDRSKLYGTGLLDAALLYAEYSNTAKAEIYLQEAAEFLSAQWDAAGKFSKDPGDAAMRTKFLFAQAILYYNRGHFDQFQQLIEEVIRLRRERIVSSEQGYNPFNDTEASYVLTPSQLRRRKVEYAQLLSMQADAFRLQGHYELAEQKLAEADAWIRQNLGMRNLAFIRNQHIKTLLLLDSQTDGEATRKMLEKNIYLAERVLTTVHKTYLSIHEVLIDHYINSRYFTKSSNPRWELRKNTARYYGKDRMQHAVSQRLDAKKEYKSGNYHLAAAILSASYANNLKVPFDHTERINLLRQMYEVAIAQDNYQQAKQYLAELIKVTETVLGKNSLPHLYAQMKLAGYYTTYTNQFKEAEAIFTNYFYRGITRCITEDHRDYVPFLNQLSEYYQVVDKYDSAKVQLNKALGIAERGFGKESIKYAIELEKIVELQMVQGNYNEADRNIKTILTIFRTKDHRAYNLEYSNALETAAQYYATMGLFAQAQEALTRANRLFNKTNTSIASSTAIDELAYLYIKMERFRETERMLAEAIDIRRSRYGDSSRFLINPYNQLARLKLINGDYIQADELVNKALKISTFLFGEKALRNSESITIISELNTAMGDYERAKVEINRVIELQETNLGKHHIKLANSLTQLALIKYYNKEKIAEVEKLLLEAEQIISANLGKENPIYAEALKNLAMVYTESQKFEQSRQSLDVAGGIWTKTLLTPVNIHNAEIKALLGDNELKQGNISQAATAYDAAMNIYGKKLSKSHPLYTNMLARTARMYYAGGNFAKSQKYMDEALSRYKVYIRDFFPALSDREKNRYWAVIRNDFDFYNNLIVKRAADKPALIGNLYDNTMLAKPLLLSSSIKVRNSIRSSSDTSLRNNYEQWVLQKEILTRVIGMSEEQQKEENLDPRKIQKEIDELEKKLSRQSSIFQSHEEEKTWQQVKAALKKGEAAVEIIRYRYFDRAFTDSVVYAALLITPDMRVPKFIPIPDTKKMESNYLKYYRNSVKFAIPDRNSYQRYWQPIDKWLVNTPKVYLSVEGIYNQLNLESFLVNDSTYVIDQKNLVLLTTTKDLVNSKNANAAVRQVNGNTQEEVVLVGNPTYYNDLQEVDYMRVSNRKVTQLPGTQIEVNKIHELLTSNQVRTKLFLNKEATEEMVKQIRNAVVLHIATHGFFEPDQEEDLNESALNNQKVFNNPLLRAGLLLAGAGDVMQNSNFYAYNRQGGVLTAYEVANNMQLDNTDLVLLSACETGRGEVKVGEGVYGLQRAFQIAGAKNIVMSLFKVSDEATQKLMAFYYYYHQVKKMDKRHAFIEAKKELRKEFKDPIYWGSFVMVGEE